MPTLTDANAIRKAAVLIRSLDEAGASAVLARLSQQEAQALRAAVRELGDVSDEERRQVAGELRTPQEESGVELAFTAALERDSPEAAEVPQALGVQKEPEQSDPFGLEADADVDTLVACLRHEQPQTVAAVLSSLAPARAAAVLTALPDDHRPLVLDRIADLGDADPESLQVITSGLRDWIAERRRSRQQRTQRLETIEAILSATGADDRRGLLASVSDRVWRGDLSNRFTQAEMRPRAEFPKVDAPKAEATPVGTPDKKPPAATPTSAAVPPTAQPEVPLLITFAEIERLPAAALAQVLRHASAEHLLLALAGGGERLLQKITAPLTRRQAASLRKRVTQLGPTRLRDIELAQHAIARVASELLRRGWITPG